MTNPQQQHRQHEIPADGGGPAYPWADPHQTSGLPAADPGMSLRDWFAGQALAGLASRTGCYEYVETMTRDAFTAADAMLVERAKEASTNADPDPTQS